MKRIILHSFTHLFLYFGLSLTSSEIFGQKITSFTPETGPVGTTVTITGTGFGLSGGANVVFFGTARAVVTGITATSLSVRVPFGATYQPIAVFASGGVGFSAKPFITTFGCGEVFSNSTLAPKVDFYAGNNSSPIGIAAGDLNGDGKPDLVTTAQDANGIVIYENMTSHSTIQSGSFGAGIQLATGVGPTGIVIVDLNGDSKLDLVVTNYSASSISIYQNNNITAHLNSSSFGSRVDFATSSASTDSAGTTAIAAGDLDGDGRIDLAVANYLKSTVGIFRSNIAGNITSSSFTRFDLVNNAGTFALPNVSNPTNIAIADMDSDLKPELIFNNSQFASLTIAKNTSTPGTLNAASFATRQTFGTAFGTASIAAGDLNNDNKPDLVLTNTLSYSVSVYRNTSTAGVIGSGTLATRVDYATNGAYPANIAIADITGDGKPDIITGARDLTSAENTNTSALDIFRNTSTDGGSFNAGSFAPTVTYNPGGSGGTLAIADLDEDGKPDIAVPNYYSNIISVLKNNSSSFNRIASGTVTGSTSICNDGVWYNIFDPSNPTSLIASIQNSGANLGVITGDVYVEAGPPSYSGRRFLPRHFVIKGSIQQAFSLKIRLYFTDVEFNALRAADNSVITLSDLAILKYQGPTEDGVLNTADATSVTLIPSSSIYFGTYLGAHYAEFTGAGFSEFWIQSGAFALPVDLLSFTATALAKRATLEWKVANEVNLDNYLVERSSDGTSFSTIGTVSATGAGNAVKTYSFNDLSPLGGMSYYRIQQKDKDGKVKYSEIRQVSFSGGGSARIIIAPNPVVDKAVISLSVTKGLTSFDVFNLQGNKVRTYSYMSTGSQTLQVSFERKELPSGTYFYRVSNGGQPQQQGKLVIR